jgi:hypothetical protein
MLKLGLLLLGVAASGLCGSPIMLQDTTIAFEFDSSSLALLQVSSGSPAVARLAPSVSAASPLWTVQLLIENGTQPVTLSAEAAVCTGRTGTLVSASSLTLAWTGCVIAGNVSTVLGVTVNVHLTGSGTAEFTLAVAPSGASPVGLWAWSLSVGGVAFAAASTLVLPGL